MAEDSGKLVLAGATTAMVVGIFQLGSPGVANVAASDPNDKTLANTERTATWLSAAVVSGVALVSREPLVFLFGAPVIVGLAWWHRAANMTDPKVERLKTQNVGGVQTVPAPGSADVMREENDTGGSAMGVDFEGVF